MIDVFTKYVTLDAVKKPTACVLWGKLEKRIEELGKPSAVLCDQGTQFTAKYWVRMMKARDIKLIFTSVRHPQANPVERTMRELSRLCRAYCQSNHRLWAKNLQLFSRWINSAYHESTGTTPYELQFGILARDALQDLFNYPSSNHTPPDYDQVRIILQKKADKRNKRAKKQTVRFNRGDLVLLKANPISSEADAVIRKFLDVYEGPYEIKEVLQDDVFLLQHRESGKMRGMFHINLLKPFVQLRQPQTLPSNAFAGAGSCNTMD